MDLHGKSLGILLTGTPEHPSFHQGLRLAAKAMDRGVEVYLYCLDDAVVGLRDQNLQSLRKRGLRLFACGYGARKRGVPLDELAVFAGLSTLADVMANTDRFLSFPA
jgi:sulfur relay (sulfurtransferase) complex TusBCD TusD component (DsrE family)